MGNLGDFEKPMRTWMFVLTWDISGKVNPKASFYQFCYQISIKNIKFIEVTNIKRQTWIKMLTLLMFFITFIYTFLSNSRACSISLVEINKK